MPEVFLSTNGEGAVSRASRHADGWRSDRVLEHARIRALAVDAARPARVVAGGRGAWLSDDAGASWRALGLEDHVVTALAVRDAIIVAGLRPAGIVVSLDGGATWEERPSPRRWWWFQPTSFPMTPHVQALALTSDGALVAGGEVGGAWRSSDLGRSWERARGAVLDCHTLAAHPVDPSRVAEGGAGLACGATSADGGRTFRKVGRVRGHAYGWAAALDADDPAVSYHSASAGPYAAHGGADAKAVIVRNDPAGTRVVGPAWTSMPYGLASAPGRVFAALADGSVHASRDGGSTWADTGARLGAVERAFVLAQGAG